MKFSKGLLVDPDENAKPAEPVIPVASPQPVQEPEPRPAVVEVEKNRLFQTVNEESSSSRHYLKVLGVFVVLVVIAGAVVSYLTLPEPGDRILAPRGLEAVVRDHMVTKEKRDSTDIAFYQCEGFYWARVGVETRNDLPNPVFRIGTYAVKATGGDSGWNITAAAPISSPEMDVPCK